MAIELQPLGKLRIKIDNQRRLDGAPGGTRVVGTASSCVWEDGPVSAHQIDPPANDWVVIDAEGNGRVDARIALETDDGAVILIRYQGRIAYSPEGASVVTAPTFETNDERYAWLNHVQAIAKGGRVGGDLVYEVYTVK